MLWWIITRQVPKKPDNINPRCNVVNQSQNAMNVGELRNRDQSEHTDLKQDDNWKRELEELKKIEEEVKKRVDKEIQQRAEEEIKKKFE